MSERPWLKAYEPGVRPFIYIPEISMAKLFQETVKKFPERPAVIYQNDIWTYSDLAAKIKNLAAFFQGHFVSPGDRLLIVMENSPDWVVAFLAVAQIGAEAVLFCPCLSDEELRTKILQSRAVGIVAEENIYERLKDEGQECLFHWAVLRGTKVALAKYPRTEGVWPIYDFTEMSNTETEIRTFANHSMPSMAEGKLTVLQFVDDAVGDFLQLTHRSLLANAFQAREWLRGMCNIEKILVAMPLSYAPSLSLGLLLSLTVGACLIMADNYDFFDTMQAIHDYCPEVVIAMSQLYSTMAGFSSEDAEEYLFWPVQVWLSVSGSLTPVTLQAFREITGHPLIEVFCMNGCLMTHMNPGFETRFGSIGVPIPNTDAKIVDLVTGKRSLAAGEVGELVVAGDQMFENTWLSKTQLPEAFYASGKLAWMDYDGFFYLLGKKEEAIISGERVVFPGEVEATLKRHPAVKECVCLGLKDQQDISYVKALIVPCKEVSEAELIAHCRLHLSPYKVPRQLEICSSLRK